MVLEKLGGSLREALRKIAGASYVDESLIKEIVRDIQRALIQADVNVQLALGITKQLQRRALEEKPPPGMSPREHVVRIIYEELVKILGSTREVPLQKQRILLVGLYGQGKTTTAGKLAKFFQKKGLSVGLVAADVHRPAAYDQLKQPAEQMHAAFYGDPWATEAVKIAKAGVKALTASDVIIVVSSGRHALEPDLIAEIEGVAKAVQADERLLVLDATVGQQAGPQAKAFHDAVGFTGVIVTKLDGTAKGGGALSAVAEVKAPIVIIGVGGKMKDADMENTQARLRRFKIIMDSMTDDEMKDPKLVKSSRVQRIARGAGVAPRDVKELLRNYEMSRKAIKGFAGNRKMRKQLLQQLEASGVDLDQG